MLERIKHIRKVVSFKLLPRRRVVERSFGWLNRVRRLSKDYVQSTSSNEAMTGIMLRRLGEPIN